MSHEDLPAVRTKKSGYLPDIHRSLPQSLDAEKGLLCSALLSPDTVLSDCIEKITEDHFYRPSHRIIYQELLELQNAGKLIDFITLTQALKDKQKLDQVGAANISELFTFISTASNSDFYLEIVREKYLLRQLISTCTEYASRAYDEQSDVKNLLDEAEAKILQIGEDKSRGEIITSNACAHDAMARYEAAQKAGGAIQGLTTGIPRLDYMLRGMRGGQMIVIAAKQKRGKSSLAWQIVDWNAIILPNPIAVGVCSLEMGKGEITDRRNAMLERIDLSKLDSGSYTSIDEAKITKALARVGKSKVFIRDEAAMNMMQIRTTFRRMVREHQIKLGMIDYLQIISPENRKDSRERQVADMSRQIKMTAKELDIPIIVLIQLNKDGDARESTAIEMDCDKLIVIEAEDEEDWEENPQPEMSLRVKYNRAGPCGRAPVTFHKKYTVFEQR